MQTVWTMAAAATAAAAILAAVVVGEAQGQTADEPRPVACYGIFINTAMAVEEAKGWTRDRYVEPGGRYLGFYGLMTGLFRDPAGTVSEHGPSAPDGVDGTGAAFPDDEANAIRNRERLSAEAAAACGIATPR